MSTEQAPIPPAPIRDDVVAEIVLCVASRRGPTDVARVRELADREWARYQDARVRTFLPVLVRRAVVDQILSDRG